MCIILTLHTLCFQVSQELLLNNTYKTPDRLTEDSSSQVDVLRGCPLLLVLWFSGTPLEGRQPIANSCLTARHLTKELKEEEEVLRRKIIAIFYVRSRAVVPWLLSFFFCFLLLNNKDPFEGKTSYSINTLPYTRGCIPSYCLYALNNKNNLNGVNLQELLWLYLNKIVNILHVHQVK